MKHIDREELERYMNAAQSAMFQYQLIEEGLKSCIAMTHRVIKIAIPNDVSFDYEDSEFDSMPLERLLKVFRKLTKNKALVQQLNSVRESRNYIAHKAFVLAFFSSVSETVDFQVELKRVLAAQEASISAFMALKDELEHLNALKIRFVQSTNAG